MITVLLFGPLREAAGWDCRHLAPGLATGPALTPAGLWRQLGLEPLGALAGTAQPLTAKPPASESPPLESPATFPQPPVSPPPIRVAVNQVFASAHTILQAGDDVAFLPPISGG